MFRVQGSMASPVRSIVQGGDGSLNLEPGTLNRAERATLNFEPAPALDLFISPARGLLDRKIE